MIRSLTSFIALFLFAHVASGMPNILYILADDLGFGVSRQRLVKGRPQRLQPRAPIPVAQPQLQHRCGTLKCRYGTLILSGVSGKTYKKWD